MPPATILFVCTGNICRSPLAEAVLRRDLTADFQVTDFGVIGLHTASAGTNALPGSAATPEMRAVAAEIGIDLSDHRATRADPGILADATLVFAMEMQQVVWLRSRSPNTQVGLLGKADIDDPYGSNLAEYRRVRSEIVEAVQERLPEIIALVD